MVQHNAPYLPELRRLKGDRNPKGHSDTNLEYAKRFVHLVRRNLSEAAHEPLTYRVAADIMIAAKSDAEITLAGEALSEVITHHPGTVALVRGSGNPVIELIRRGHVQDGLKVLEVLIGHHCDGVASNDSQLRAIAELFHNDNNFNARKLLEKLHFLSAHQLARNPALGTLIEAMCHNNDASSAYSLIFELSHSQPGALSQNNLSKGFRALRAAGIESSEIELRLAGFRSASLNRGPLRP